MQPKPDVVTGSIPVHKALQNPQLSALSCWVRQDRQRYPSPYGIAVSVSTRSHSEQYAWVAGSLGSCASPKASTTSSISTSLPHFAHCPSAISSILTCAVHRGHSMNNNRLSAAQTLHFDSCKG